MLGHNRPPPEHVAALIARLRALVGERCTTAPAEREHHGHGESYHATREPDAVCYPESTEEVSAVVRLCREFQVPVIPFGAGTSLEGHVCALTGGVSLDMRRMDRIIAVHAEDLDATVQAGVTRKQLNAHLRDTGLFFPVDPGADATLGGMAATRASGTNAVRYGTMRENVIALTVVLPDGRVVRTSSRARKSSAGYDLTRLFVGSEGTLGVITEVTVRLYGIPEAISSAVCAFPTLRDAVQTAIETIQCGVPVARVELIDDRAVTAVNRYAGLGLAEQNTLFFEFHGTAAGVEEQAATVRDIALGHGGEHWRWATSPEERSRLWQARHDMHYACLAMRPGAKAWGTDACVPISRLADVIAEMRVETDKAPFYVTCIGHVGDGNFHLGFLIDVNDPAELAEAERLNAILIEKTLAHGGTCTGEHGVGYGKTKWLVREHGQEAVDLMHVIKGALDPDGLFNPGKVLPRMTATQSLAAALAAATRAGRRIPVDAAFRALTRDEAMQVQADAAAALGTGVAGWKVAIPDGPAYAPMFASAVRTGADTRWPLHEEGYLAEVEIGVRLVADLPSRPGRPWTREELVAAIGEAFIGIELIGSRLRNSPPEAPFPAWLADNMGNGAYAIGPSVPFATVAARIDGLGCVVRVDGAVVHDKAGHPLGDPLSPILACLNAQTDRLGGFRAGQIVTTGSLNKPAVLAGAALVEAEIEGLGAMRLAVG